MAKEEKKPSKRSEIAIPADLIPADLIDEAKKSIQNHNSRPDNIINDTDVTKKRKE